MIVREITDAVMGSAVRERAEWYKRCSVGRNVMWADNFLQEMFKIVKEFRWLGRVPSLAGHTVAASARG